MKDDSELLQRYAAERDEAAFAELVRRHVNLVHSAALRQLNGDAQLAEDAAQLVFVDLARKASALRHQRVLAGWLYVSTRYAAAKLVRAERRRQRREQEAAMIDPAADDNRQVDWDRVRPVLDDAMNELKTVDREAILLRFFEHKPFADIGARLALSENAARMRVERALERLQARLTRRGVTSTSGALAAALASQAVTAAPAGVTAAVTAAALAGGGAGAAGLAAFMGMTKLQLGISGALAVAGATGLAVQHHEIGALRQEQAALQVEAQRVDALKAENAALAKNLADAERSRGEAVELKRLRSEADALRAQADATARQQDAALQAKREAERIAALARVAAAKRAAELANQPDRLPVPSVRVPPKYPAALREAGATGSVVVGFVVDAQGEVRDAFAVHSTRPEFEAAAIEAVAQWKFEPGIKGWRPVNTRLEQEITFSLDASAQPGGTPRPVNNESWF